MKGRKEGEEGREKGEGERGGSLLCGGEEREREKERDLQKFHCHRLIISSMAPMKERM